MPTSPPNGHGTHECIWQPRRWMVPHYTPQPSIYKPFWFPPFRWRGVMWVGMAASMAWKTAKKGASCASLLPSAVGAEGFGSTLWDSWGDGLDKVAVGAWWCLLGGLGWRTWRNAIELPSGAHIHPLPLILLQPFPLSAVLPSPTAAPPLSAN